MALEETDSESWITMQRHLSKARPKSAPVRKNGPSDEELKEYIGLEGHCRTANGEPVAVKVIGLKIDPSHPTLLQVECDIDWDGSPIYLPPERFIHAPPMTLLERLHEIGDNLRSFDPEEHQDIPPDIYGVEIVKIAKKLTEGRIR